MLPHLSPGGIAANIAKSDLIILLLLLLYWCLRTSTATIAIMSLISLDLEVLASIGMLPLKLDSLWVLISQWEISLHPPGNLHYPPAQETGLWSSVLGIFWLELHLHTVTRHFTLPVSLQLVLQLSSWYWLQLDMQQSFEWLAASAKTESAWLIRQGSSEAKASIHYLEGATGQIYGGCAKPKPGSSNCWVDEFFSAGW